MRRGTVGQRTEVRQAGRGQDARGRGRGGRAVPPGRARGRRVGGRGRGDGRQRRAGGRARPSRRIGGGRARAGRGVVGGLDGTPPRCRPPTPLRVAPLSRVAWPPPFPPPGRATTTPMTAIAAAAASPPAMMRWRRVSPGAIDRHDRPDAAGARSPATGDPAHWSRCRGAGITGGRDGGEGRSQHRLAVLGRERLDRLGQRVPDLAMALDQGHHVRVGLDDGPLVVRQLAVQVGRRQLVGNEREVVGRSLMAALYDVVRTGPGSRRGRRRGLGGPGRCGSAPSRSGSAAPPRSARSPCPGRPGGRPPPGSRPAVGQRVVEGETVGHGAVDRRTRGRVAR